MESKENLLNKLIYRSTHRGCKEMDILMGDFAIKNLPSYSAEELIIYDQFCNEDDYEIYDWILGKKTQPDQYTKIVEGIRKFTA